MASKCASSGMMLRLVPAWNEPTVTTTGSKTSNRRVTRVCSAVTISAATVTGSLARCGIDPCPPSPRTVTCKPSLAAMSVPGRVTKEPCGTSELITCMPYAEETREPAASSTPSSSILPAPSNPSSPGWNMKTTSPARCSRCRASSRAAPASIAVCRSCPHACIAPGSSLVKSSPVSSCTGRPSMSPRSSTAGPGRPPRSTAVTLVSGRPWVTSRPRPSIASSTSSWVRGSCSPTSGTRCSRCRRSARSGCSAAASARSVSSRCTVHSSSMWGRSRR